MQLNLTDTVEQETYDKVVELLVAYNTSKTLEHKNEINKPIEIVARNSDGELIGGLYGRSIWGTLEVKTFIVKTENKNEGIGKQLMLEAEKEAKKTKM